MINAGDGTHEHPTQALLDALTLRQRLGAVEGRRVVIVGDILHSRVARSNVALLNTLGAEVVLVAPPTLLPTGVADWGATVTGVNQPPESSAYRNARLVSTAIAVTTSASADPRRTPATAIGNT